MLQPIQCTLMHTHTHTHLVFVSPSHFLELLKVRLVPKSLWYTLNYIIIHCGHKKYQKFFIITSTILDRF